MASSTGSTSRRCAGHSRRRRNAGRRRRRCPARASATSATPTATRPTARATLFLLQNVVAGRDSGFGAWPLTDPTVVGDSHRRDGPERARRAAPAAAGGSGERQSDGERCPSSRRFRRARSPCWRSDPPRPSARSDVGAPGRSGRCEGELVGQLRVGRSGTGRRGAGRAPSPAAATDWMSAPWARDLSGPPGLDACAGRGLTQPCCPAASCCVRCRGPSRGARLPMATGRGRSAALPYNSGR